MAASIAEYRASGRPCACPEDRARNASRFGARSAYSRPIWAAPYCYPHDVLGHGVLLGVAAGAVVRVAPPR